MERFNTMILSVYEISLLIKIAHDTHKYLNSNEINGRITYNFWYPG